MHILHDERIPRSAQEKLKDFGTLIPFSTSGITYESISGHPDVFIVRVGKQWVVAPNTPAEIKTAMAGTGVEMVEGELCVGEHYPETSRYNAVVTEKLVIHNFRNTDSTITDLAGDRDLVHVDQGYTRCNLLHLGGKNFITSDRGIYRVLEYYKQDILYVDPEIIRLHGQHNGFFGGCCGIHDNKVFIIGALDQFPDGEKVREYVAGCNMEIVELYDGPLFDGGGLIFLR